MTIVARHLAIRGKVQGVFYRSWTVQVARDLGLAGWVRNRMDGSVEALVQGETDAVAAFVDLAWEGPRAARVEAIDAADAEIAYLKGFEQRSTV